MGREDDFSDLGYLVNFVSTLVLMFLMSRDTRRKKLLGPWSFAPFLLAWTLVLLIPVGALADAADTAVALRATSFLLPVAGLFVIPLPKFPPVARCEAENLGP